MGFNHRKLISASENIEIHISDACKFFCDPTRNTDGYCPISCFSECSLACRRPFTPLFRLPPPPPPEPQNKTPNSPILLLVSLSVLAAICFFFCCYSMYKYYKYWDESRNTRRRRSPELQQEETHDQFLDQDRGPVVDHPIWYIRTVGLQPSVINSIDICKYKRGDGLVEGTECSVCLNELQEDESLRLLPKCNHAFHIPCIDTWLRSHTNCPLCRAGIVSTAARISTAMPEQSVDDPGVREENQVVISESGGELRREREDGEMGIEEEAETEMDNREKSLETPEEEVAHQPMRRSVSMDSLSASMISLAIANACPGEISGNSDPQLGNLKESNLGMVPKRVDIDRKLLKLLGDCSISKSLQKQPISMKRSMSCSGKLLFSRSARSRNSIFPL